MVLAVRDLAVTRGGMAILEGVSFDLSPGEALVLRGPNGVGKTTLLRSVAGLQPVEAGTVTGAEDQMAYAGHSDGLKAMLSVTENLKFWASVFAVKDIESALHSFDLIELRNRMAGTLSAGQKRRLGLARLMVTGRPIWVLDEPTVSLDVASVALFAEAVRGHLRSGGSALMATHIDLGLEEARVLDLTPFKASPRARHMDEAFL
ncbi:heme ABC exporter ATP-binding protein CcmA [Marivita sp. S6314]|uniref:heme ABC exporter ATP-binding protein CcmA n=1 Tax=Marivita sp. S6314 TaxID=2926406 RepID=UPI001FF5CE7D|nr:heme ABC exporter ATP-binding protein CcmA [Marivita sp. S6314]MCK0148590.1 heme ABC exporter ATP-binding protein CcmA [Marivita sp. S6314]